MDKLDELEACGHGLYACYFEHLRMFVLGNIELAPVENGALGNQPLSFFDWMFGNPGNIIACESSDEEVTVEASPSEVDRNLRRRPDLMPGNRPTPVYHPNYGDLMESEAQAFSVGVPGNPHVPPGMLAPGEYGPCA
eukprot:5007650-Pyramimonas_sp.AAC.1